MDLTVNHTNASLYCQADGALSYDWEKSNGNSSKSIATNAAELTLINLGPQDTGYYRCKATNVSGSSYSKFALLSISVLPPVIAESPKNVIIRLSSTATFKCIGQGYGYVTVIWEKRNTDVPLPNKININTFYASNHIVSILTIPLV